eukprot:TRINITY_DN96014_c0_g1_i1.p1 TRINITY_DN96014_c0_g1~~TRINITY_DN96014_c0_g1_i1.p1  ORF type:complete len:163 (-),score=10.28 TRINITY_DN96014_c0_g1_i1:152-640(-)
MDVDNILLGTNFSDPRSFYNFALESSSDACSCTFPYCTCMWEMQLPEAKSHEYHASISKEQEFVITSQSHCAKRSLSCNVAYDRRTQPKLISHSLHHALENAATYRGAGLHETYCVRGMVVNHQSEVIEVMNATPSSRSCKRHHMGDVEMPASKPPKSVRVS